MRQTRIIVILSIKPEFVNKIFTGIKKYEFRRSIFKRSNIDKVIIYASSPIKMVIGEFKIEEIICSNIENLWEKTKGSSGISKEYFCKYFEDKEKGYAIKIKNYKRYKKPLCLKKDFGLTPPQSYVYLNQIPSDNVPCSQVIG